jgi:hypothetical protein
MSEQRAASEPGSLRWRPARAVQLHVAVGEVVLAAQTLAAGARQKNAELGALYATPRALGPTK